MGLIGVLTLCALVVMASSDQRKYDLEKASELFTKFMEDHNKTYANDEDKAKHYNAFVENLKKINRLNEQNPMTTFGINKFADYTPEESKSMFGFTPPKSESSLSSSSARLYPLVGFYLLVPYIMGLLV